LLQRNIYLVTACRVQCIHEHPKVDVQLSCRSKNLPDTFYHRFQCINFVFTHVLEADKLNRGCDVVVCNHVGFFCSVWRLACRWYADNFWELSTDFKKCPCPCYSTSVIYVIYDLKLR